MLTFLQNNSKEVAAICGVLLTFVLNRVFRLRARLFYSIKHSFNFVVKTPLLDGNGKIIADRQIVRTASIFSQNTGLSTANGVEYTFNWRPTVFNVTPPRHYTSSQSDDDRFTVRLESLAPGEAFSIEIMSFNQELPILTAVRCDEAEGKLISVTTQRQWPAWVNRLSAALLLAGIAASIYTAIAIAQWLTVKPTPAQTPGIPSPHPPPLARAQ